VTFQVALRGSDGILLASDTQGAVADAVRLAPRDERLIRWMPKSGKIAISRKHNVTVAMAGINADLSFRAAAILLDKIENMDSLPHQFLWDCVSIGDEAYKAHHGPDKDGPCEATLLVIAPEHAEDQIFRIEVGKRSCPFAVKNKIIAGDTANAAIFFVERYYDEETLRPLSELRFLAAHTVLMGATLTSYVAGLEMVVCRQGSKPERVEVLDPLPQLSAKLDKAIKRSIFKSP
jgi:hypothetical protein